MESCQQFNPSYKTPSLEKPRAEPMSRNPSSLVGGITTQQHAPVIGAPDGFMGILEVFIHQARDIHNICIYHKQDVYAKICLTNDPEVTVSTQTINGGGKNPVFNENLRLNVQTIDASLKCEVWMLSRVKNYLEDQLLGFALVPLADVVMGNGKLVKELPLSSTDLFHSPAGFVQLSISYHGSVPEVMAIPSPSKSVTEDTILPDSENDDSVPCEFDNLDFPDLTMVKENQMMVSEYIGIPCTNLDSQDAEKLVNSESGNCLDEEAGVRVVESFVTSDNSLDALKKDSPQSSVSTNGSPTIPATSQSLSGLSVATASSFLKDKTGEGGEGEADSSSGTPENTYVAPIININIEPEQTVVQQDIVDMYMKSMQQFTDSLAKMKLPMDMETNSTSTSTSTESPSSGPVQKSPATQGTGSRVFYGSRAFF